MSKKKKSESYEVGYGKPPKHTQFQAGVSGNPNGRPKKTPDFDTELIKESGSPITINDNGRRRRISKHAGVIKQVINKALTGDIRAARLYLGHRVQALEKAALLRAAQASDSELTVDKRPEDCTDEELIRTILAAHEAE